MSRSNSRTRGQSRTRYGPLLVTAVLVISACGGDDDASPSAADDSPVDQAPVTSAEEPTPVTSAEEQEVIRIVQVNADPSLGATMAFHSSVPDRLGYFEEEGLSVETRGVQGADTAAAMVQSGQADFVQAGGPAMVQFSGPGSDNLVVVYLNKSHSFRVVVPEDSEIQTAEDLNGATIGTLALAGPLYQYGRAVVVQGGLDPDEDVNWLPAGFGTQAAAAFEQGEIQAYAGADSFNAVVGQLYGTPMRDIEVPSNTLPAFGAWLVRREMLEENPDVVARFIRATLKGMTFANANPEAAVDIHWEAFPTSKPADADDPAVLAEWVGLVQTRIDLVYLGRGSDGLYGTAETADFEESLQFQVDAGLLAELPDLDVLVDLSLAEDYNDFDEEAVIEQARNF